MVLQDLFPWNHFQGALSVPGVYLDRVSPAFLAPGTNFTEENFSMDQGLGDGFRWIQVHYIYCIVKPLC